jgi:hypothetical protein
MLLEIAVFKIYALLAQLSNIYYTNNPDHADGVRQLRSVDLVQTLAKSFVGLQECLIHMTEREEV